MRLLVVLNMLAPNSADGKTILVRIVTLLICLLLLAVIVWMLERNN